MSLLKGGCRFCDCAQQEPQQPQHPSLIHPNQRLRRRRHASQQDEEKQHPSPRQPTLVLIQSGVAADEKTSEHSLILCKWSPTLPRPSTDTDNSTRIRENILAFDESVKVILKPYPQERIDCPEATTTIHEMLYRYCEDYDKDADDFPHDRHWSVRDIDASLHCTCHDSFRSSTTCGYLAIETEEKSSTFPPPRVAIPLFTPTIQPLQSLIISIVEPMTTQTPSSALTAGKVLDLYQKDSDSSDRMRILLEACWKRQLVGKVLVANELWASRVQLEIDNGNTAKSDRRGKETSITEHTVYVQVESMTPLQLTTPISPSMSSSITSHTTYIEQSSLPEDFYVVLPSTYITIRRPPSNEAHLSTTNKGTTVGSFNASSKPDQKPPSPAARLLMDTLDCIRKGDDGGDIPRTFLLSGAPGVGKTFSVSWAASANPDTVQSSIRGSELLQDNSKDGTDNQLSPARALEWEFLKLAKALSLKDQTDAGNVAGLLFLDECDALVSVEPIAAMLADLLDRVSSKSGSHGDLDRYWKRIVVVGATNRIDSIPSYLRRAGRFDRELPMSPPSAVERAKLLSSLLAKVPGFNNDAASGEEKIVEYILPHASEIQEIAELCVGYVAADLSALVRKAWILSLQDGNINGNGTNRIAFSHLDAARDHVGASALRDASLAAPPKMTWDDIAGDPGGAKTALRQAIEWPRLKAREFEMLGLQPCRGILLHGPPGCAKTTLARAAAGSSGVAFLSLSPAQVYASSYVGEAERVVRQAFHLARSTSPCILFFDEIDSIFGSGGGNGGESGSLGGSGRGSSAEARVLSTFLNEMDGVDIAGAGKDGVLVLGATNRPWTLDPALLRPGRLGDKIIFLPPPDGEARRSIFERQLGNAGFVEGCAEDGMEWKLDYDILVELSEGMTGAEIMGACQEAKIHWMRETVLQLHLETGSSTNNDEEEFKPQDFIVNALISIKPLLSNPEALEEFQVFENRDRKIINR